VNTVTIYNWSDAPLSLRELVKDLIPEDHTPMWLAWTTHKSAAPSYAGTMLTRGFLEMERGQVLLHHTEDGGEVRIGCVKKRAS